jgi:lipopolysaccharide/colanic/teichoic acid biosynthesis glycosyltransferase
LLEGVPILGGTEHLGAIIVEQCIDELQVALPLEGCMAGFSQIHEIAKAFGIPVALRVELLEGTPPSKLDFSSPIAAISYNHHRSNRWPYRLCKRSIDIAISAGVLIVLSPVFAMIALAVKLTSPGSILFKQPRVGLRRREFKMWKFRTMVKNAEQLRKNLIEFNDARGASFKIVRDPRLTSIGRFLRRTSLDELPQFINILRGEMSLAGPRPIPLWVADQLEDTTYYRRFHVMPGLTGWWQVQGREQDFEVMARQDLYYVDNWSLSLDLRILLDTVPAVVRGRGAH